MVLGHVSRLAWITPLLACAVIRGCAVFPDRDAADVGTDSGPDASDASSADAADASSVDANDGSSADVETPRDADPVGDEDPHPPACLDAGGNLCVTVVSRECSGLPLLESSDCEECCFEPPPVTVTFVQANVHLTEWDEATALHFARLMNAESVGFPIVVGVQELRPEQASTLRDRLSAATGDAWDSRITGMGISPSVSSGIGLFWRTAGVELVEDCGSLELERLRNGYVPRIHGAIFRPTAPGRPFGVFTGKLSWYSDDGELRVRQARALVTWVQEVMSPYPESPRILAIDMNDVLYSPVWHELDATLDDGDATIPTAPASSPERRIDYLWWDADDGPRVASGEGLGFLETPRRSEDFGSDHRLVWAHTGLQ